MTKQMMIQPSWQIQTQTRTRTRNMCLSLLLIVLLAFIASRLVPLRIQERRQGFTQPQVQSHGATDGVCVIDQPGFTSKNRVFMYYAPWCTHCAMLKPEFDKAASMARMANLDVCFVTVNASLQPRGSTCIKDKGASMFPTIQLESEQMDGQARILYNGLRNASDIFPWVNASLGPNHPV